MPTDWGKSAFGLKSLRPNLTLGGRILDTALCAGLLVTWPRRLLLLAPVEMLLNLSPEEFGWPLRTAQSRSPLCLLLPSLCKPEAWSHTGGTQRDTPCASQGVCRAAWLVEGRWVTPELLLCRSSGWIIQPCLL